MLTLTATGTCSPRAHQSATWASAAPRTYRVIRCTSPVRSASGTNSSGGTSPRSGWRQRTSASVPSDGAVGRLTFGW